MTLEQRIEQEKIGRQDLLQQALDVTRASLQGAPND